MQEPPEAPPETEATPAQVFTVFVGNFVDAAEQAKDNWINGGWTVKKRQGKVLPEIRPNANDIGERTLKYMAPAGAPGPNEPIVVEGEGGDDVGALAPIDVEATASLTTATDRELQGDFLSFLAEREADEVFKETDGGEIVFSSREQLAGLVSQFAYDKLKELSAAARALARYVEDLENELEAADDTAVAMRKEVLESERKLGQSVTEAEDLRQQQADLAAELSAARAAIAREQEAQAEAERGADLAAQQLLAAQEQLSAQAASAAEEATLKASAAELGESAAAAEARAMAAEKAAALVKMEQRLMEAETAAASAETSQLKLQATLDELAAQRDATDKVTGRAQLGAILCAIRRNYYSTTAAQFGAIL